MCGISGIYSLRGQNPDPNDIRLMNQYMIHRGPDDEGIYSHGPVSMGMRRLSIIDPSSGHQPIYNESRTVWVILNGEIYNYRELRQELEHQGHIFYTNADTEVLVHLYEEYGVAALNKLNGMFAFALYDEIKQALWIARDRVGIKPLYYATHRNQLIFASHIRALNKLIQTKDIHQMAFLSYLATAHAPLDVSMFNGIQKLLPGHYLWLDNHGIQMHRYWDVTDFQTWEGTSDEAAQRLDALLHDAVRLQLRSDVPLGISLSGGIDSGAIAFYANQSLERLTTLTIDFDEKQGNDTRFARDIAKRFNTNHIEIPLSSHELLEHLDDLILYLDEPIADSAIIASYVVALYAKQSGIKVLLNGAGGDELFGGYLRYHAPLIGSTAWFAERLPDSLRQLISYPLSCINRDKYLRMQEPRIAYGAGYTGSHLACYQELFQNKSHYHQLIGCYLNTFENLITYQKGDMLTYSKMYSDLTYYLVGNILALSDQTTMACSVEGRVPLLDHRLVEFAFSLPKAWNLLDNEPKGLLKKVLHTSLPRDVLSRKKEGFNAPISIWMQGEFFHRVQQELIDDPIPLFLEQFKMGTLKKWVALASRGHLVSNTIFSLYLFSRWYRCHVIR